MAEVADILDQEADPGACEVYPYKGPLAIELRPAEDFTLECSVIGTDTGYDMNRAIMKLAYPALLQVLEQGEGEPDAEAWSAAVEAERRRELHPSPEWADGVRDWWEQMSGGDADKTAALRDMMRVTIPGEPKPETPEQERLFQEAQERMMEGVGKVLSGASKPPKESSKKPPKKPSKTSPKKPPKKRK
jgi:hypothetical protein